MYILIGPAVVTDTTRSTPLATGGRVVDGVAADGVAQIVLRIPVPANLVGQQLTLKVIYDRGADSQPTDINEDGGLMPIGGDTPQSNITVTAVDTDAGSPMAFAIYRAPLDFARESGIDENASLRRVSVHVQSNTGFSRNGSIKIVRPPLALIHGIWSDPNTWRFFNPLTEGIKEMPVDDSRFRIRRIDYGTTSADGFMKNAILTLSDLRDFLKTFKEDLHVAAVQADVVAHSIGGDIARTWVLLNDSPPNKPPFFLIPENYLEGDVHKLITLDTPHLGSELANKLLNSNPICRAILGAYGITVGGAVSNLAVNSTIILQDLQQQIFPLQAHAIAGIAEATQTAQAESNYSDLGLGTFCPSLLPPGGFQVIFSGPSDLIVSELSQRAMDLQFSGGEDPPSSNVPISVIHAVDTRLFTRGPDVLSRNIQGGDRAFEQTPVPDMVINLLNQPVTGSDFGPILP